jgi:GrpB-like predicted nucleotidyltransferase (UPF0157 family)
VFLKPKKVLLLFFIFLVFIFQGIFLKERIGFTVFAKIQDDINKITQQITDLENAINPLKKESTGLQSKISLAKLGYIHKGDWGIKNREVFQSSQTIFAEHNLYVCLKDSLSLKNHLLLRDTLRSNPKLVQEYGNLKKELAIKYPNSVDTYCRAKTSFLIKVLKSAGLNETQLEEIQKQND